MNMRASKALFSIETLPGFSPLPQEQVTRSQRDAPARRRETPAVKPLPGAGKTPPQLQPPAAPQAGDAACVANDSDAAAYFARLGDKAPIQFFYAIQQDDPKSSRDGGSVCAGSSSSDGSSDGSGSSSKVAGPTVDLRVVPPAAVANAQHYFIISCRQVVRVDRGDHTDTIPLAEWMAHKRAFMRLRELTFFGSFALAKCFTRWRRASRAQVLHRRRQQLQAALLLACPAFKSVLVEAGGLLAQVRAVRTAGVQPGRLYSTVEWLEQQSSRRARRVQPDLEAAMAALVRAAEVACQQVEMRAHMQDSVTTAQLADRIGVDLYAPASKAKARSMQQIRVDKEERAHSYHRALAERTQLPRFLRLLDLRLAGALADMAAASVADVAGSLRAAAGTWLLTVSGAEGGTAGVGSEAGRDGSRTDSSAAMSVTVAALGPVHPSSAGSVPTPSPVFSTSLVFCEDGSVAFSPSAAEWEAALHMEAVAATLQVAGGVPVLLTLPAFERYQAQLVTEASPPSNSQEACRSSSAASQQLVGSSTSSGEEHQQQQDVSSAQQPGLGPQGPAELAEQDSVLVDAVAEMKALLRCSFEAAGQVAQQYQQYHDIQRFGTDWDLDAWAAQQRVALDLTGTEATLHQLQQWREQLEAMPLAHSAGLLRLDASELKGSLAPLVALAQERITSLLLQLAGEKCRKQLAELAVWLEVAAARPSDPDGFLAWAAELARMQQGAAEQLAAAADTDAALELVLTFAGRLPAADAVKRDDLREMVAGLQAELAAAGGWEAEQHAAHEAAVREQEAALQQEAIVLEGELTMGQFTDPDAASSEVLTALELQQARYEQLAAQAQELARLRQELCFPNEAAGVDGSSSGNNPWELRDAAAALQLCTELWGLVAEAEELHAALAEVDSVAWQAQQSGEPVGLAGSEHVQQQVGLAGEVSCASSAPRCVAPVLAEAKTRLVALRERLAAARGPDAGPPDAIWLRASNVLHACQEVIHG